MATEVDRLVSTETTRFLRKKYIPQGEKAVYTRLVVDLRWNKEVNERLRICMGGEGDPTKHSRRTEGGAKYH